jgi:hypothetical protein
MSRRPKRRRQPEHDHVDGGELEAELDRRIVQDALEELADRVEDLFRRSGRVAS